jgi:predicted RecA/RadA family phage recombinase
MKTFLQPGATLEISAPYAAASGAGVQVGAALFGVAMDAMSSGAAGVIATEGCYQLAKTTGQAYTVGQRLFWDNSGKLLTATSTSNLAVGVAIAAAASADTVANVRLQASTPAGT